MPSVLEEIETQEEAAAAKAREQAGIPEPPPAVEPPRKPEEKSAPSAERLLALDAFRGLTILGMLLVNNIALGGATPTHLTHAEWSGRVHFADLVFPWFLLIAGASLPFSAASHRRKGGSWLAWGKKALGRAIDLLLMGCLIDSTVMHQLYLGLGVLQIIGLASFVAALLLPLSLPLRLIMIVVLLGGYGGMLHYLPLPNAPTGTFTEETNAVRYLNDSYLTPLGLRGLLSVAPTSALVLLGTVVGDLLRLNAGAVRPWRTVARLLIVSLAAVIAGLLWSRTLPMNKPTWSPSYILFAGGAGVLLLTVLFCLTDALPARVRKLALWTYPLLVPGANAIVAYALPILVRINILETWRVPGDTRTITTWLQEWCYAQVGRIEGGWLYTACYIGFWWLVLFYLYRKKIFLRL